MTNITPSPTDELWIGRIRLAKLGFLRDGDVNAFSDRSYIRPAMTIFIKYPQFLYAARRLQQSVFAAPLIIYDAQNMKTLLFFAAVQVIVTDVLSKAD